MHVRRRNNWLLKSALTVMSCALAALGIGGWAYMARVFDAAPLWGDDKAAFIAALDPLWIIYAIAAIGCIAAQILGACVVVNFAERLKSAKSFWRWLALGFYGVAAVFAAKSADIGATAIIDAPHRAAYEARVFEREALTAEIAEITKRIADADAALAAIDTEVNAYRAREARERHAALTKLDAERLPIARAELDARPPLPRERTPEPWEGLLLLLFLAWAFLEPWGYAMAELGRTEIKAPPMRHRPPYAAHSVFRWPPWARRAVAVAAAASAITGAAAAEPIEPPRTESVDRAQPAVEAPKKRKPRALKVRPPTEAEVAQACASVRAAGRRPSVRLVAAAITADREKRGEARVSATRLHDSAAWRALTGRA